MSKYTEYLNESTQLNESGLSRVWKQTQEHDYGTITAYRDAKDCNEGEPYTTKEKKQMNKSLLSKLQALRYGVTKIKGSYIENYGTPKAKEVGENSFIVIDILDKGTLRRDLLRLGEEFEQDSIIFGVKGRQGTLIGTNKCPNGYPGYHKTSKQGGAIFGETGEFMSRVKGRPFIFSEDIDIHDYGVRNHPTTLRGAVHYSKLHWSELIVD